MLLETLPSEEAVVSPLQGAYNLGYFTYGDIDPTRESIFQGLYRECRFSGQTPTMPWTVLQHSALVAWLAGMCLDAGLYPVLDNLAKQKGAHPVDARVVALLHDAPEAYYKDLPWPMKQWIKTLPGGSSVLAAIEDAHTRCLDTILKKFFLFDLMEGHVLTDGVLGGFIKDMDLLALYYERRWFFPKQDSRWSDTWHVDVYMRQDRMIDALVCTLPAVEKQRKGLTLAWAVEIFNNLWPEEAPVSNIV